MKSSIYFLIILLIEETESFVPLAQLRGSKILLAMGAKEDKHLGRLEPLEPPEARDSDSDTPGLSKGADSWPAFVREPVVQPDTLGETPGMGGAEWPSPVQEPKIGFGSGPSDTPGLPKNDGIPPFIEEPRVW